MDQESNTRSANRTLEFTRRSQEGERRTEESQTSRTADDATVMNIGAYARTRSLQFAAQLTIRGAHLSTEQLPGETGTGKMTSSVRPVESSNRQGILERLRDSLQVGLRAVGRSSIGERVLDSDESRANLQRSTVDHATAQPESTEQWQPAGRGKRLRNVLERVAAGTRPSKSSLRDTETTSRDHGINVDLDGSTSLRGRIKDGPTDVQLRAGLENRYEEPSGRSLTRIFGSSVSAISSPGFRLDTQQVNEQRQQDDDRLNNFDSDAFKSKPGCPSAPIYTHPAKRALEQLQTRAARALTGGSGSVAMPSVLGKAPITLADSAVAISDFGAPANFHSDLLQVSKQQSSTLIDFHEQAQPYHIDAMLERVLQITDRLKAVQIGRPVTVRAPRPRTRMSGNESQNG